MNKIATLTVSLWVAGTAAHAGESPFNQAVNLYLKGYADCREANSLRADDIKAARQRFDQYLKILDQAAAIDPTILKTNERDMDANLTFCERVNNNLKMAEAAPVLEEGFTHCEKAKASMDAGDLASAQQEFDGFTMKRDEALAITSGIMGVYSLASQVRACGRLEDKLLGAKEANDAETKGLASLTSQLQNYSQKCQAALSFTRQSTFTIDNIDQANQLLAEAQQARKQAASNTVGNKAMKNPANAEVAAVSRQTEDAAGRCEVEVSTLIRNMLKQRQIAEETLDGAISTLQQADKKCAEGKQLIGNAGSEGRTDAQNISKQVRYLIEQASTPTLSALAKRHPGWPQSKTWQQLSVTANQCQQALQLALAKPDHASASADAPPSALPSKAQASTEQAPTSKKSEETRGPAAALPHEATAAGKPALATPEEENDEAAVDVQDATQPEESPAPSTTGKKSMRKSWTDLVR